MERVVLQCNRQRDTKGNEVAKVTSSGADNADKRLLKSRNLDAKVIRGHYNFFGIVVTQLKYGLCAEQGGWRLDVGKNQCVAKKSDNAACDLVSGGRQCQSGKCNLGHCYTPNSVAMGGTCYVDDACKGGKCSAIDGAKGSCVCKEDSDCGSGSYCDAGADFTKNSCLPLKNDNDTCDLVGGGHQCKSGQCKFSRCYTPNSVALGGTCYSDDACKAGKCSAIDGAKGSCVCESDSDCGAGKWCDAGLDTKVNACRAKLDKGASCGKQGSVGNDHKCKSGKCSGFPDYKCK